MRRGGASKVRGVLNDAAAGAKFYDFPPWQPSAAIRKVAKEVNMPAHPALFALLLAAIACHSFDDSDAPWKKAGRLMEEKDYKNAIVEYTKVIDSKEAAADRRAAAAFNIGCCHGRLSNKPKALEFVIKAIDLGFSNEELLTKDPAIKEIRNDPKIKDAVARLQKKREDEKFNAARDIVKNFDKPFKFEFDFPTLDGKKISSKDLLGKVAIIDIWGTWCPPCREEIPHFVKIYNKYKDKGFAMVGLNNERTGDLKVGSKEYEETREKINKFAQKFNISYPLAIINDATQGQVPGFRGFPTTIFLGRDGTVKLMIVGGYPADLLEGIVEVLMNEDSAGAASKPAEKEKK